MTAFAPVADQLAVLERGAVDLIEREQLVRRLEESRRNGRPLRVKFGIDPSSPDIHVGHTVPLRKLAEFQRLGHTAIVLWGTATAMVGDPSGRDRTRPQLTRGQVEHNKRTYRDQIAAVIDVDRIEERENSEWFDRMSFLDAVRLTGCYTVARLLERDSFAKRHAAGQSISVHEFLYPLMQGHDSVELRADVELGGSEQLFNLMVGRELQRQAGQEPQVCLTTPLIEGLDGSQKMSKSLGNAIGVADSPTEMFGKTMRVPDALMHKYFTLLTDVSEQRLAELLAGHPRAAKVELARRLVTTYHGADAAERAVVEFDRMFREGGVPDDVPLVRVGRDAARVYATGRGDGAGEPRALPAGVELGAGLGICHALVVAGLASSSSEARRHVQSGAVRVDGAVEKDPGHSFAAGGPWLLQVGKRRAARLEVLP